MRIELMKAASFHDSSQLPPQSPVWGQDLILPAPRPPIFLQHSSRHREGTQNEFNGWKDK